VVGLVAIVVLAANLVVDLLYGVVDPRIRFATSLMERSTAKG